MTRASVKDLAAAVVAHPATPWVAYPFAAFMFAVFGYRQYHHVKGLETVAHATGDWVILGLGIVALPVLRDLIAAGGLKALELYRALKAVKEPK